MFILIHKNGMITAKQVLGPKFPPRGRRRKRTLEQWFTAGSAVATAWKADGGLFALRFNSWWNIMEVGNPSAVKVFRRDARDAVEMWMIHRLGAS